MDTVIIQLTTPKTMKLLQELEELHLLRILKKTYRPKPNCPINTQESSPLILLKIYKNISNKAVTNGTAIFNR